MSAAIPLLHLMPLLCGQGTLHVRITENRLDVYYESQLFNSVYGRNRDTRESHETHRVNYDVLRCRIY